MIKSAMVILRYGHRTMGPIKFTDSRGIAVGNEYMLNVDGHGIREWRVDKIVQVLESKP